MLKVLFEFVLINEFGFVVGGIWKAFERVTSTLQGVGIDGLHMGARKRCLLLIHYAPQADV